MALTLQGTPQVSTTSSVTIPTHAIGDIIVIFAFDSGATTTPGKPSASGTVPAWVDIRANTGASLVASRLVYFVATATNTTSGTWTSTAGMIAAVLRGQSSSPIGGNLESGGSTAGSNVVAPAVTLTNTDGSSVLLHFFGVRSGITNWGAAPAGYTHQIDSGGTVCLITKNSSTSDGSVAQTNDAGNTGWRGATLEVLAPQRGRLGMVNQAVNRAANF